MSLLDKLDRFICKHSNMRYLTAEERKTAMEVVAEEFLPKLRRRRKPKKWDELPPEELAVAIRARGVPQFIQFEDTRYDN